MTECNETAVILRLLSSANKIFTIHNQGSLKELTQDTYLFVAFENFYHMFEGKKRFQ